MNNKKIKQCLIVLATLVVAVLVGCSDDLLKSNDIGSTLEEVGEYKISTFTLSNEIMGADESLESVVITLKAVDGSILEYDAAVEVARTMLKCRMRIPKTESIPDGEYVLTARVSDGTKLGGSVQVVFKDEMLHTIQATAIEFTKLSGEGTQESPYLIGNTTDFTSLISNLRRDSIAHGTGLYFRQTASFSAPTQSELYDGRGYFNYSFAGNYDGGGFAIQNLYYVGAKDASKDSGVGMFAELLDGAVISNLTIDNFSIMNTAGDCGALAGKASGVVKVSNVNVSGSIVDGGNNCGGLIGSIDGELHVNGYDFSVTITGSNNVGGLLGYASDVSCVNIRSVSTEDHRFSISGTNHVGGVVGYVGNEYHFSRIVLEHTVSSEDKDLKIISGSGNSVGGVLGHYAGVSQAVCSLDSIKVKCPVGGTGSYFGGSYVGGLVGYTYSNVNLTVNYCQVTSVITGDSEVGGLFGHCQFKNSGKLVFTGTDNLTKVVADDAAASVSGTENIGGLIGWLDGLVSFDAKVRVAVDVTSTSRNCGGAFGYAVNTTCDLTNLVFDSTTMYVKGGGECTGGIFGYLGDSDISGPESNGFDFWDSSMQAVTVPEYSRFTPMFKGVVNGLNKNGGVVGKLENSTARRISAQCSVTGNGQYTGGLFGYVAHVCTIEDCSFGGGQVTGKGDDNGGIIGILSQENSVTDCVNYAPVTGSGATAGCIGCVEYNESVSTILSCVNTGAVTGTGYSTGGVIGYMRGSADYETVLRCANYGEVIGSGGSNSSSAIGGIVGFCNGKKIRVLSSANHGRIYSSGSQHGVGGIAGSLGEDPNGVFASQNLELGYCCNRGEVECGNSDAHLGGILGYQEEGASDLSDHDSWLHDCINFGHICSGQSSDNGGILGCADHYSFIEKSVNFGDLSGNATIGTHKSACIFYHERLYYLEGKGKNWCADGSFSDANKGKTESYEGFDFTNVWEIKDGYPALRDCPFQSVTFSPKD